MMTRKVAIVAGGDSGEYEISVRSGRMVYQELDRRLYEPYFMLVRGSAWTVELEDGSTCPVDLNDFSITVGGKKIRFDVVFVAIHGTPGEDGKLLGYLDLLRIPYTCCDQLVSALTFNKHLCKQVVAGFGIPVAASFLLRRNGQHDLHQIMRSLGLPLFVKPNNSGSSVGVSKVKAEEELKPAIDLALTEDEEVVLEAFMPGREITCGVIRNKQGIIALPVTEIIPKNEFFDYDAKYTPGKSEEIVPADIPEDIFRRCQEMSALLYDKLRCRGVVRFDYIFEGDTIRFLEVNSVPGMTEASIVPKMARAYGWTVQELFTMMLEA